MTKFLLFLDLQLFFYYWYLWCFWKITYNSIVNRISNLFSILVFFSLYLNIMMDLLNFCRSLIEVCRQTKPDWIELSESRALPVNEKLLEDTILRLQDLTAATEDASQLWEDLHELQPFRNKVRNKSCILIIVLLCSLKIDQLLATNQL